LLDEHGQRKTPRQKGSALEENRIRRCCKNCPRLGRLRETSAQSTKKSQERIYFGVMNNPDTRKRSWEEKEGDTSFTRTNVNCKGKIKESDVVGVIPCSRRGRELFLEERGGGVSHLGNDGGGILLKKTEEKDFSENQSTRTNLSHEREEKHDQQRRSTW